MAGEHYRTVREVAELLKVSEATVRRWIRDGELRAIDIGKGWRIASGDLDAFLEDHATRPADGRAGRGGAPRAPGEGRNGRDGKT
ncbi:MAG: helix-turn-helix domain-containing protein [Pseudomonadota bacterium]